MGNYHYFFLTVIFETKFTLWHIKLSIYIMYETKFTSHKQYLFGSLYSIKAKKTHTDQSTLQVFLLFPISNDS